MQFIPTRRFLYHPGCFGLVMLALLSLWWPSRTSALPPVNTSMPNAPQPSEASAHCVGHPVCATCHAEEDRLWRGSHHDLAMQAAAASAVLGDFADKTFAYHDIQSRFFRRVIDCVCPCISREKVVMSPKTLR